MRDAAQVAIVAAVGKMINVGPNGAICSEGRISAEREHAIPHRFTILVLSSQTASSPDGEGGAINHAACRVLDVELP